MARPLRIEFAGALYHVTARGNRREPIFLSDSDRFAFHSLLGEVCDRFNWSVYAWCQMGNHYHLLLETPDGNLSAGMRQLNGVYTQRFNGRNRRVGHLLQGRYHAVLIEKEAYLLEVARYVMLNPLRARMVRQPEDWPWSSYRATIGAAKPPEWLDTDWLLSQFGTSRAAATKGFRDFVESGRNQSAPWEDLRNQVFLGSDTFVARMRERIHERRGNLREVPSAQRRGPIRPLAEYQARAESRDKAIVAMYRSGGYTLREIGVHFGLHYSRVSRIVARARGADRRQAKGKT